MDEYERPIINKENPDKNDLISRLKKETKETFEASQEVFVRSVEFRANNLKAAYEEGWLKNLFIGAGLLGLGLVYHGLSNNNETTKGAGYGILIMDALYTALIYRQDILTKIKNFINH